MTRIGPNFGPPTPRWSYKYPHPVAGWDTYNEKLMFPDVCLVVQLSSPPPSECLGSPDSVSAHVNVQHLTPIVRATKTIPTMPSKKTVLAHYQTTTTLEQPSSPRRASLPSLLTTHHHTTRRPPTIHMPRATPQNKNNQPPPPNKSARSTPPV